MYAVNKRKKSKRLNTKRMGKVIHWKVQEVKFEYANKGYMNNPELTLENETLNIIEDFAIRTDHLISARRPDLFYSHDTTIQICR